LILLREIDTDMVNQAYSASKISYCDGRVFLGLECLKRLIFKKLTGSKTTRTTKSQERQSGYGFQYRLVV